MSVKISDNDNKQAIAYGATYLLPEGKTVIPVDGTTLNPPAPGTVQLKSAAGSRLEQVSKVWFSENAVLINRIESYPLIGANWMTHNFMDYRQGVIR